jgi:hypothetical protein
MASMVVDPSSVGRTRHDEEFRVEVRRPLHRPSPAGRLVDRWRARREQRRASRAARKERGDKLRWWEVLDVPFGDLDAVAVVVLVIAAVALLVLSVVFVGPFLWILILFLVDLLLWVLLALAGLGAWLLLGRPWQVVVIDHDGATIASAGLRGRRQAREHAAVVRKRIADGANPAQAVKPP